jgi:hypothetical protein
MANDNFKKYGHFNASTLGAAGYRVVYGDESPDADFISYKDKWVKKSISTYSSSSQMTAFELKVYFRAMRLVAEHYTAAVGRFYNMAVVLSNKCYFLYKDPAGSKLTKSYEDALAIVWRLLYEGFGLAGWSPKARLVLGVFTTSASNYAKNPSNPQFTFVKDEDWWDMGGVKNWKSGFKPSWVNKETPQELKINALDVLPEWLGIDHLPNAKAITRILIWACYVSINWGAIEQGKQKVAWMKPSAYRDAVLFGSIRRAGQGNDWAGLSANRAEQELEYADGDMPDVMPQSCLDAMITLDGNLTNGMTAVIPCEMVRETVEMAAQVHRSVNQFLLDEESDDYDEGY